MQSGFQKALERAGIGLHKFTGGFCREMGSWGACPPRPSWGPLQGKGKGWTGRRLQPGGSPGVFSDPRGSAEGLSNRIDCGGERGRWPGWAGLTSWLPRGWHPGCAPPPAFHTTITSPTRSSALAPWPTSQFSAHLSSVYPERTVASGPQRQAWDQRTLCKGSRHPMVAQKPPGTALEVPGTMGCFWWSDQGPVTEQCHMVRPKLSRLAPWDSVTRGGLQEPLKRCSSEGPSPEGKFF